MSHQMFEMSGVLVELKVYGLVPKSSYAPGVLCCLQRLHGVDHITSITSALMPVRKPTVFSGCASHTSVFRSSVTTLFLQCGMSTIACIPAGGPGVLVLEGRVSTLGCVGVVRKVDSITNQCSRHTVRDKWRLPVK